MFTLNKAKIVQRAFQQFIEKNELFSREDRLAIAVSGGMDSMCAVHLLERMECSYLVLHANFQLRGEESQADADFVEERCNGLAHCQDVLISSWDTSSYAKEHGLSTQEAARSLRYDWFQSLYDQGLFDKLIIAHHQGDRLETFLINAYRVSGLRGLASIPLQRDYVVRPMMAFDREQIQAYVQAEKIPYREDSSNQSDHYLRNAIRLHVLPEMEEKMPQFQMRLERTMDHLRSDAALMDFFLAKERSQLLNARPNGGYAIDILQLNTYPQSDVFLYHLLDGFGFTLHQCRSILESEHSGPSVESHSTVLYRDRDHLLVTPKRAPLETVVVDGPGSYSFGNAIIALESSKSDTSTEHVHLDPSLFPLTLRTWKEGDFILPFGMGGQSKLLSDLFVDLKIPRPDKDQIPLLCSGQEVFWVAGIRISEKLRRSGQHPANLHLSFIRPSDATMT